MTDEMLRENIRKNLIYLRIINGLTQTDVAEIVGKKKTTVATWEQGKSLPDLQTLYRLSIYYGKELEYFYHTDEGSPS